MTTQAPRVGSTCLVFEQESRMADLALGPTSPTRVLLVSRGKDPHRGKWVVPGGGVRFGESLAAAAAREVKEEANVDVDASSVEHKGVYEIIEPGEHRIVHVHHALSFARLEPKAGSDALDARMFEREQVRALARDGMLSPTAVRMLQAVRWLPAGAAP